MKNDFAKETGADTRVLQKVEGCKLAITSTDLKRLESQFDLVNRCLYFSDMNPITNASDFLQMIDGMIDKKFPDDALVDSGAIQSARNNPTPSDEDEGDVEQEADTAEDDGEE